MNKEALDTVVYAETPEGIMIELRPAGLTSRFYAFLLDWLIRIGILYAAAITAAVMSGFGIALMLILFFALEWLYPVIFELSRWGATPGKRVMGLRVVMDSGLPITPLPSSKRGSPRKKVALPSPMTAES